MKFWPDDDVRDPAWVPIMVMFGMVLLFMGIGAAYEGNLGSLKDVFKVCLLLWMIFALWSLRMPKWKRKMFEKQRMEIQAMFDADMARFQAERLVNNQGDGI